MRKDRLFIIIDEIVLVVNIKVGGYSCGVGWNPKCDKKKRGSGADFRSIEPLRRMIQLRENWFLKRFKNMSV